jgi:flagellar biosynthesis protein FlhF
MKVKKYTASSMPEAMKKIRSDLGVDAIILNTKEANKGGIFGLFSKKYLEVTAAVDPDPVPIALGNSGARGKVADDIRRLENEIKRLKSSSYPGPLADVWNLLQKHGVEAGLTEKLMKPLLKDWYTNNEVLSEQEVFQSLHDLLVDQLTQKETKISVYGKKVLVFIGPTGVGKTTTLAKIAAKAKLEDGKAVAFITADTYRIAAVNQLKTYADILNVPIEVAYTKDDFHKAKKAFADHDLVLVDTAGRNFREPSTIGELKQLIPFEDDTKVWLVFSMTSKYRDMKAIFRQFASIPADACVLTKIDETRDYGSAANLWLKDGLVPAFFTNGQTVPDDLIQSTPRRMAEMLTGGRMRA